MLLFFLVITHFLTFVTLMNFLKINILLHFPFLVNCNYFHFLKQPKYTNIHF